MKAKQIDVYISDNCTECEELVNFLHEENITFRVKNTSRNKQYLSELQEKNVFLTPAIIIDDYYQIIGFQRDKIERFIHS